MSLTKKEKFMMFVYLGAIARDISNDTTESQMIANYAQRIPEERIPINPVNAAKVYVAYWGDNDKRPYNWMFEKNSKLEKFDTPKNVTSKT